MCNLCSITQPSRIALFQIVNRYVGNPPPMPGGFPDFPAPMVATSDPERELAIMRGVCRPKKAPAKKKFKSLRIGFPRVAPFEAMNPIN